jgi:hypothetical protein
MQLSVQPKRRSLPQEENAEVKVREKDYYALWSRDWHHWCCRCLFNRLRLRLRLRLSLYKVNYLTLMCRPGFCMFCCFFTAIVWVWVYGWPCVFVFWLMYVYVCIHTRIYMYVHSECVLECCESHPTYIRRYINT